MKLLLLSLLSLVILQSFAQQQPDAEHEAIRDQVNKFFKALETKDTVLYKNLVFENGQIWTVSLQQDTLRNTVRRFSDDMKKLVAMKTVIEERPLKYQITIHNAIAIAWVPYTISLNGQFSNCGIDVFTFIKTNAGWKIVNSAYSIEPNGCEDLKKQ